MKRQIIGYSVLGLLAYLLFLAWTFPADRALVLLRPQLPALQMSGVTGTVWSGRAATLHYHNQRFSRLTWQFQPLALFKAQPTLTITFAGDGRTGTADVGLRPDGTIVIEEAKAQLPMAELSQQLGIPVSLGGVVDVAMDKITINNSVVQSAEGKLQWRDASMTTPVLQKLGAFNIQVTTEDAGIKALINDAGGPLQLEGTARLINDGSYQFSAKAAVRDAQQTLLQQALQAAGRPESDGRILIEYHGRL